MEKQNQCLFHRRMFQQTNARGNHLIRQDIDLRKPIRMCEMQRMEGTIGSAQFFQQGGRLPQVAGGMALFEDGLGLAGVLMSQFLVALLLVH